MVGSLLRYLFTRCEESQTREKNIVRAHQPSSNLNFSSNEVRRKLEVLLLLLKRAHFPSQLFFFSEWRPFIRVFPFL